MSGAGRRVFRAACPEETRALAAALGARLEVGDAVALSGPLGAGKTLFVKGLVAGLGGAADEVASPSFALVARYGGRLPLVHVDLYRLTAGEAAYDLGVDEAAADAVLAVEWAERAPALLPADRVEVTIEGDGDAPRRVTLAATGPRSLVAVAALPAPEVGPL